jgi:hypothetical protein
LFDTSLRLSSSTCHNNLPSTQIHRHQLHANNPRAPLIITQQRNSTIRTFSSKSDKPDPQPSSSSSNTQHETWVEFQKSISVTGFETGQTTKVTTRTKKRGGSTERKRRQREEELEAALSGKSFDITTLKGGEFPPLRYSEDETQRLLEEAYGNIPPRAGKRGTLHLKREKRRWFIKRMYDVKKRHERMAEHEARMEKRHGISVEIFEIQQDAEEVRSRDREYQNMVLERWAVMNGFAKKGSEGLVEQNE